MHINFVFNLNYHCNVIRLCETLFDLIRCVSKKSSISLFLFKMSLLYERMSGICMGCDLCWNFHELQCLYETKKDERWLVKKERTKIRVERFLAFIQCHSLLCVQICKLYCVCDLIL